MSALTLLAEQLEAEAQTKLAQAVALREMDARPTPKVLEMGPRTLSLADTAARLTCSKSYVRRLIHEGELKVVRITKRAFRVAESDVVALIRRRTA